MTWVDWISNQRRIQSTVAIFRNKSQEHTMQKNPMNWAIEHRAEPRSLSTWVWQKLLHLPGNTPPTAPPREKKWGQSKREVPFLKTRDWEEQQWKWVSVFKELIPFDYLLPWGMCLSWPHGWTAPDWTSCTVDNPLCAIWFASQLSSKQSKKIAQKIPFPFLEITVFPDWLLLLIECAEITGLDLF